MPPLAGLSILTAQVFTTEDAAAVDLFEVGGRLRAQSAGAPGASSRELRKASRVAFARPSRGGTSAVTTRRRGAPSPVTVSVDNEASDFFTVIEVGAADRIGLLYDMTRTLAELDLDVHLAKVATFTDRVIDAFYVRDGQGRKIEAAEAIGLIETTLLARLAR